MTIGRFVNRKRRALGLEPYRRERDWHSRLAQISQCPDAFDFPRYERPDVWHGVGPIRESAESRTPFPFERLDGRPLVYASLGSLQGGKRAVFAAIAEACAPLDLQLVITHNHSLSSEECAGFAGDPVVVPYAPQTALLARSSLVITHAGMNTVLDALAARLPMVTIPITFEQPAIAARVVWHGVGETVPFRRLSATRLRSAALRVLREPGYRLAAAKLGRAIDAAGGLTRAVSVIEQAFSTGRPVRTLRSGPLPCEQLALDSNNM